MKETKGSVQLDTAKETSPEPLRQEVEVTVDQAKVAEAIRNALAFGLRMTADQLVPPIAPPGVDAFAKVFEKIDKAMARWPEADPTECVVLLNDIITAYEEVGGNR